MLVLRWKTNQFLIQQPLLLIINFYHVKNYQQFERMSALVFNNWLLQFSKKCHNCKCVMVSQFFHNCLKISMHNCEIHTIGAIFSWKIATFVTAQLFKCNWIDLWSMGALRIFRKGGGQQTDWAQYFGNDFSFWQSHTIMLLNEINTFLIIALWYFYEMSISTQ